MSADPLAWLIPYRLMPHSITVPFRCAVCGEMDRWRARSWLGSMWTATSALVGRAISGLTTYRRPTSGGLSRRTSWTKRRASSMTP